MSNILLNRKSREFLEYQIVKYPLDYFSFQDISGLIESALSLITHYIKQDPLCFMTPLYHEKIYSFCFELLKLQLQNLSISDEDLTKKIHKDIHTILTISFNLFHKYILPKRSYNRTFIRVKPNYTSLKPKLTYLQNLVQPNQRTDDWYTFRHNTLTASNLWKIFGSLATQNQLIYEKCKPLVTYKASISTNSPLHWGQKYEPVSILYYQMFYKTHVSDFGCIRHNKYSFIAASPDGINTLETSELYGRMLEIKNIVSREITGIPKLEYWIQMQIQMETCNLNECDFLETKFLEYENEEAFNMDGSLNYTLDGKNKGMILYFVKDNIPYYEYMPLNLTKDSTLKWEEDMVEKHINLTWIKNIYWKLEKVSCILVLRNKFWFQQALPHIEKIWDTISKEKDGNYEHRAPKKRARKVEPFIIKKCYIDTDQI